MGHKRAAAAPSTSQVNFTCDEKRSADSLHALGPVVRQLEVGGIAKADHQIWLAVQVWERRSRHLKRRRLAAALPHAALASPPAPSPPPAGSPPGRERPEAAAISACV